MRKKMKQRVAEQKVFEKIQKEMKKEGIKVKIIERVKNNGEKLRGIAFQKDDMGVAPVSYFNKMRNMEEVEKQVEWMKKVVKNGFEVGVYSLERKLLNDKWESMKDKIVFRLLKKKGNEEFLKGVVYKEVLDLALVFYMLLENEGFSGSIGITETLLKELNMNEQELYETAKKNTPLLLPPEFTDIETIIQSYTGLEAEPCGMYVLRNASESYGAGTILYDGVLERIAEQLNGNFYIIPSSIHECIIIEADSTDKESLDCMVREINSTALEREDVLENHAYLYDRDRKEIMY